LGDACTTNSPNEAWSKYKENILQCSPIPWNCQLAQERQGN